MSSHSPLPWRADEMAQYIWANDDKGSFPVLQIRGWGHLTGVGGLNLSEDEAYAVQQANADYIVRCVNAHEALVAALRSLVDDAVGYSSDTLWIVPREVVERAGALLTSLEATRV